MIATGYAPACVGPCGEHIIGNWWAALCERDRAHIERALAARWLYSTSPSERESPRVPNRKRHPQPPIRNIEREYMGLPPE